MKKNNFIPLLTGSYYSIFFIGMYYITRGLLLPQIQNYFGVNNTVSGLIYLIPVVPCLLTQLLSGYIFKIVNKQKFLLFSASITIASSLTLPFASNFAIFIMISIANGIGIVLLSTGSSLAVIDTIKNNYPKYTSSALSFYHSSYSLGAVLVLLFMTFYANNISSWKHPLIVISITGFIALVAFSLSVYPEQKGSKKSNKRNFNKEQYFKIIKNPLMLKYAFLSLLYAGLEGGIANWIAVFLEKGYGELKSYSSLIFLLFFSALTLGRILGAIIIHKLNKYLTVYMLFFISIFCIIMAFGFRINIGGIDIFIPLCGLSISMLFPSFQSFLADDFKEELSISNSIFFAGNMIGGSILVFLIGLANDIFGEKWGLLTIAVYITLMIPVYLAIAKQSAFFENFLFNKQTAQLSRQ